LTDPGGNSLGASLFQPLDPLSLKRPLRKSLRRKSVKVLIEDTVLWSAFLIRISWKPACLPRASHLDSNSNFCAQTGESGLATCATELHKKRPLHHFSRWPQSAFPDYPWPVTLPIIRQTLRSAPNLSPDPQAICVLRCTHHNLVLIIMKPVVSPDSDLLTATRASRI
jgi:hypothetical protein